jgi:glycosyltransferase involved in cell wall biosynthesis
MGNDIDNNEEIGGIPGLTVLEPGSGVPGGGATDAFPSVSVIIPSYSMERWDYLLRSVASVRSQTVSPIEIIVVIDYNPELLARVTSEIPEVITIPNVGLRGVSGARNSGVKASHGEVVAFLDDDVVACNGWLARVLVHLRDPAIVGAAIRLEGNWESPRPAWFPREFDWTIGLSYAGMPTKATVVRNVWTSTMVVRRSAFEVVGGFREDFGKIGARNLPEDTDLCLRISSAQGDKGLWIFDPSEFVLHQVSAGRTTYGYFVSRCFLQGWGKAAMARLDGFGASTSRERDYTRRILPAGVARGLAETLRGDISGALRSASIIVALSFTMAGYLWYILASRGGRAKHA